MQERTTAAAGSGEQPASPPVDAVLDALLELTEQLSAASAPEDVARIVATTAVASLGASAGFVAVERGDGAALEMVSHVRPEEPPDRLCQLAADEGLPVVEAWRLGVPVLLRDPDELYRRYPDLDAARTGRCALAALPLEVDGFRLGALNLTFARPQAFDERQCRSLRVLAALCAQALRRARLSEEVERTRHDFAVTASHELRSPLTAVYAAAIALASDMDIPAPARGRLMDIIVGQAERMTTILDDLQLASDIDGAALELRVERVDLRRDVLDDVIAVWERRPEDHERVRIEVQQHLPPVRADVVRLQQLVSHLVDNACKYSPRSTPVRVVASMRADEVLVRVLDEGPGLDEQGSSRAFEKFYRGDAMQRNGVAGTGLGLSISRAIATAMGARLWLEPRDDGRGLAACLLLAAWTD